MNSILITDLDNTLYNWVDYFAPSFRGMVHALAREMEMEEENLIGEFKTIFKQVGTLEYSFIIQKLPSIKKYSKEDADKFVEVGRKVFARVRQKNLIPYAEVKSTLEYLRNEGVLIIAVTNAPAYFAEARLKQLRLDKYIYGLAAWQNSEIPRDEYTDIIIKKNDEGYYRSKHIKRRWEFSKDEIKPNPFAYLTVLDDLKTSHKLTYVVGDSISKDLNPAQIIGAKTIWAKYGTVFKEKNFKTLLKITHWDEKKIKKTYEEDKIKPDFVIYSFGELRNIVEGSQLRLFK